MTLIEKIMLADQFISREPDATIKDFVAAVEEIEAVEKTIVLFSCEEIGGRLLVDIDGTPPLSAFIKKVKVPALKPFFRVNSTEFFYRKTI